jgi:MoxR-like ATPase
MTYPYYRREVADLTATADSGTPGVDHPSRYLPEKGLEDAVNVALVLNRPLLLTGKPGTGKTQLAYSVAWQLAQRRLLGVSSAEVEKFETKSTTVAKDLFYSFDTLRRFHAAYVNGSNDNVDYITYNALGRAILNVLPQAAVEPLVPAGFTPSGTRSVVLIDEIDKAPRDFPNDLLNEIEQMYFRVPELGRNDPIGGPTQLSYELRPIVIITSNSERNLPPPFLRRCIYYDIQFPDEQALREILLARLPRLGHRESPLLNDATTYFMEMRKSGSVQREISPAELIQWLSFMLIRGADPQRGLAAAGALALESIGALAKDPEDRPVLERELKARVGAR